PPKYLYKYDKPLIFLAGPIQGAPKWHQKAMEYISKREPDIYIASPRRPIESHSKDFPKAMYEEQVDWETFHLRKAGNNGVVMFWLAKEEEHLCERAYAQTTRFELAEWKMMHQAHKSKLVIGIEEGFTNARYIRRRFSQDCPNVPIYSTLEETCAKAVEIIKKRN
ncbi:MAG: nucleoside 2-deoxyribosyltransferase domain-containing protein, partial [Nanoarchaeota archaeon]|nr:nucleoside 2-deoxyribosyltransferase domain-containing protein [Nanoarchaeota archaeon]